ncbi:hypothetical protein H920_15380 [Fukomys damarensis]|uniref:Uncharacterized protein n=1 Tax=Fukomys damarensis TaxID=885580 RepID=A0A091CZB1_FUKDA|nr:hypothetical protein H920_15380 [Fukomys damarensis]
MEALGTLQLEGAPHAVLGLSGGSRRPCTRLSSAETRSGAASARPAPHQVCLLLPSALIVPKCWSQNIPRSSDPKGKRFPSARDTEAAGTAKPRTLRREDSGPLQEAARTGDCAGPEGDFGESGREAVPVWRLRRDLAVFVVAPRSVPAVISGCGTQERLRPPGSGRLPCGALRPCVRASAQAVMFVFGAAQMSPQDPCTLSPGRGPVLYQCPPVLVSWSLGIQDRVETTQPTRQPSGSDGDRAKGRDPCSLSVLLGPLEPAVPEALFTPMEPIAGPAAQPLGAETHYPSVLSAKGPGLSAWVSNQQGHRQEPGSTAHFGLVMLSSQSATGNEAVDLVSPRPLALPAHGA